MATTVSPPRERLLSTARRLFYSGGIHAVPVDRLVTEAGVTRATFYRHFPAKEDLVEAYLRATDADLRAAVADALDQADPQQSAAALLDLIGQVTCSAGFRGCHFINASAEYPDPADPVRVAVAEHRAWFQDTVTRLARQAGHPDPDHAGRVLVLLHDGALSAAELDDPQQVSETVIRAGRELLGLKPSTQADSGRPEQRDTTQAAELLA
ncbi:TetR/AcrR family transcriptional regulator [Streptantibioticus ferralitis]|uniref:TetR/AcrR family transcriptional regulator n=1 Tax=Streptantibioticus ferralitis TaxID=236510 RepID=A0ABT5Z4Z7_9ACTN|nr:TetR/AcrR family transcriptional regulator [Streptantibioticus ferralitis]MDF2258892.1 TetR/AcrR family transcriptional regulator [Streptantibioticus ferralitis]